MAKSNSLHFKRRAWITGAGLLLATAMMAVAYVSIPGRTFNVPTNRANVVGTESATFAPTAATNPIDADALIDSTRVKNTKQQGLDKTPNKNPCAYYVAGIINHHALATDLLMRFASELKRCRSDLQRIIVLSPDHFLQSRSPFATHERPYQVNGQFISVAITSIHALLEQKGVAEQPGMFDVEHGLAVPIWFITQQFPSVEIVPVDVKADINQDQIQPFETWLTQEFDAGTFVLVSSDMSHYLQDVIALSHDQETRAALAHNDSSFFWNANDGYACNAKSIFLTLSIMKNPSWHELGHSISTAYGGSTRLTTSYITGFWSIDAKASPKNE